MTYAHYFKECFHDPKKMALIPSNLDLFHVTVISKLLQRIVSTFCSQRLPSCTRCRVHSSIISQIAVLVSVEIMWLPREARVGVAPALSRASKQEKLKRQVHLLRSARTKRRERKTENTNNRKRGRKGWSAGEPNKTGFTHDAAMSALFEPAECCATAAPTHYTVFTELQN